MMMRTSKWMFSLIALGALGGCSTMGSHLSCPLPHGVTCMSAVDVYHATNHADHVSSNPDEDTEKKGVSPGKTVAPSVAPTPEPVPTPTGSPAIVSPRCCHRPVAGLRVKGSTLSVAEPTARSVASLALQKQRIKQHAGRTTRGLTRSAGKPVSHEDGRVDAFREKAKIMRIYIAPWQDKHGDLHLGGYIYSDITPALWAVVEHGDTGSDHLLRLLAPQTSRSNGHPAPAQGSTQGSASSNDSHSSSSSSNAWQAGSNVPPGEPGGH